MIVRVRREVPDPQHDQRPDGGSSKIIVTAISNSGRDWSSWAGLKSAVRLSFNSRPRDHTSNRYQADGRKRPNQDVKDPLWRGTHIGPFGSPAQSGSTPIDGRQLIWIKNREKVVTSVPSVHGL
jgi:hypothetical protein